MKVRKGYVSNSSSMSFLINNLTDEPLTIVDFVKENPQLVEQYQDEYEWERDDKRVSQKNLVRSAEEEKMILLPGSNVCIFGDEDGTLIGRVFDYILRDGGSSERFSWELHEALR